jgi:hypothetical protein
MFELHVAPAALDIWVETETRAIHPRARGALRFGNPYQRGAALSTSSYAGLARISIPLHKIAFPKSMDCRVKPGNDESERSRDFIDDDLVGDAA